MDIILNKIINNSIEKKLSLGDGHYKSSDSKTILAEVPFKDILFLAYRDTEIGRNPREYAGLSKTNVSILKSLIDDSKNKFRFLHSGIIVSMMNPSYSENNCVQFDECCLTNGNQTRFIILILTIAKSILEINELKEISKESYKSFIASINSLDENMDCIDNIIRSLPLKKVNEIIRYIKSDKKLLDKFNSIKREDFLESLIRIQINVINQIVEDLRNEKDNYFVGTTIAEANNTTQKVSVDDIFGSINEKELNEKILNIFNKKNKGKVQVSFRDNEFSENQQIEFLKLIRPIVATGLLTKEDDIYKFTNHREPVYKLFGFLMKRPNYANTIVIVSKLIPSIYDLRAIYIEPLLQDFRRQFKREYLELAIQGRLKNTIIADKINKFLQKEEELDRLIKPYLNYNSEHILPVFIYRCRKLFKDNGDLISLDIQEKDLNNFVSVLIKAIYKSYIDLRLNGLPSSLTTTVRSEEFYKIGDEAYNALLQTLNLKENDFIKSNSIQITLR